MRKLVMFITAGIIISTVFPSCKKSYTCECINTMGKESTSTVTATNRTEAQRNCDEKGLLGHCKIK